VLAVLCLLGCLLGWAGLAMLARMSWASWAGQVRLDGFAFIIFPFCLDVVSFFFRFTFFCCF
jgi:hypothetical protein